MSMPPQVTYEEMIAKLVRFGMAVAIVLAYVGLRSLLGKKRYLASGQVDERTLLQNKDVTLADLQAGPWRANTEMTITYASFGLNVMVLAVVFIFEQRLTGYDALMFDILLAISAISVLAYFVSLQCWLLALDLGGTDEYRVRFRYYATASQTIGWLTLVSAGLFAVLIINTPLGFLFSILAACSIVFMLEFKARSSIAEETRKASLNDFQNSIQLDRVYVKDRLPKTYQPAPTDTPLRVLTWNIERGYRPAEIAAHIRKEKPDIVCLQEVDWNNRRTGNADVLDYLAQATEMLGLFSPEFHEIQTPSRGARLAGGGVHGNAILSRHRPVDFYRLDLPEVYDWNTQQTPSKWVDRREKRQGSRHALVAEYLLGGQRVVICCTHLEDKAGGVAGRFMQYSTLVQHIQRKYDAEVPVIICGDFNTFDNWLTRAIGLTSSSQSLGKPARIPECKWWQDHLLPSCGFTDPFSCEQWTVRHGPLKFKLDWITARNCEFLQCGVGKQNLSDHYLLWAELRFTRGS